MSTYCPYDATSATYDTCRRPLDLDDLLSRIERLCFQRGCPASDLRLLDVGAGSGNYYQRMRERGCMVQYHGLDFSQGMLDQVSVSSLLFSSHLSSLSLSLSSLLPFLVFLVVHSSVPRAGLLPGHARPS